MKEAFTDSELRQILLDKLGEGNYLVVIDDGHKVLKDEEQRKFIVKLADRLNYIVLLGS